MSRGLEQSPSDRAQVESKLSQARPKLARYGFRELLTWYRTEILPAVGASANFFDIDDRQNRIVVGVWDPSRIAEIRQSLASTDVPANAVEVIEVQRSAPETRAVQPPSLPPVNCATLRDTCRPVAGGLKIETIYEFLIDACTVAYNFRPAGGSAQRYAVTNSHCSRPRSQVGTLYLGQSQVNEHVGFEVADPPFHDNSSNPNCPVGKLCRFTDAALFEYYSPSNSDYGHVALPSLGSISYSSHATVVGTYGPTVGQSIRKVGQVTGHTSGSVTNACIDEDVPDTNYRLLCIASGSYSSSGGDSGGSVFELFADGSAWAVGVHHGSGGRFSPMYSVINEFYSNSPSLGLMEPITDPPLNVSITGVSTIKTAGNYTWTCNASGGVGDYSYLWERSNNGGAYYGVGTNAAYSSWVDASSGLTIALRCSVTSGSQTVSKIKNVTLIF
jgi:hypothetical protein